MPLIVALRVAAQPAETGCLPCPGLPPGWLLAAFLKAAPLAEHPACSAGLQHEALPAVLFWGRPGECHSTAAAGPAMRCPVRWRMCRQAVAGGPHVQMVKAICMKGAICLVGQLDAIPYQVEAATRRFQKAGVCLLATSTLLATAHRSHHGPLSRLWDSWQHTH